MLSDDILRNKSFEYSALLTTLTIQMKTSMRYITINNDQIVKLLI